MKDRYLMGYKVIYRPDHFNTMTSENWKGYVYEHRFIVESRLGRPLFPNEEVHHLDCNKSNNHPSNLIVVTKNDHNRIHFWIDNGANIHESYIRNGFNSKKSKVDDTTFSDNLINDHKKVNYCLCCGSVIFDSRKKCCSIECSSNYRRSISGINYPTIEQLSEDIKNMTWTAIGRKYGVSDNAVRKWAKKYNLL